MILLFYLVSAFLPSYLLECIGCFVIALMISKDRDIIMSPLLNKLKSLKRELMNEELMKYSSKHEYINRIIEFVVCIVIFDLSLRIIRKIPYTDLVIIIELVIVLIVGIYFYIKFLKTDVFTEEGIENKQKLQGLKKYLDDYSLIEDRKAVEIFMVRLFDFFCFVRN